MECGEICVGEKYNSLDVVVVSVFDVSIRGMVVCEL